MRTRRPAAVLAALALAAGGVLVVATPAHAADQIVTNGADTGAGSLRAAVAAVGAGETITFAPGVTEVLLESEISVPVGVTIQGPGASSLTIARGDIGSFALFDLVPTSEQDFVFEGVTLDGRVYPGLGSSGSNAPLIVSFDAEVDSLTLRDVTMLENTSIGDGGGLMIFGSSGDVVIEDSTFTALDALEEGGAVYVERVGDVTIRGSVFGSTPTGGNSAQGAGGAVRVLDSGAVVVEDSDFVENESTGPAADGAGLSVDGIPALSVTDSLFVLNEASDGGEGGGISASDVDDTIEVTDTEFDQNTVGVDAGGAGLFVEDSAADVTVTGSLFQDGEAVAGAGITFWQTSGEVDISETTFFGNTSGIGGAMWIDSGVGPVTISGSSFSTNGSADVGGAIYVGGSIAMSITTTEFVSNTATAGGAIAGFTDGRLIITSSQFRDNDADGGATAIHLEEELGPRALIIDSSTFATTVGVAHPLIDLGDISGDSATVIGNSTIDAGTGADGPAVRAGAVDGALALVFSTIVSDVGLRLDSSDTQDVDVLHTAIQATSSSIVIVENPDVPGERVNVSWSAFSLSLDADDADDIVGNQTALGDLGLEPLAENGGPTYLSGVGMLTRLLEESSPLVDAGQDPPPGGTPDFDERGTGFARVIGSAIDIGATEFDAVPTTPPTGPALAPTGGTVSWWLFAVAGLVLALGAAALIVSRLRSTRRH